MVLSGLLMLPAHLSPIPISPFAPWTPEALVLATLLAATVYLPIKRWMLGLGMAVVLVYWTYAWYDAMVYTAFQRHGVLYEDIRFVVDALYLIPELASPERAALGGVILATAAGMIAMMPRLMRAFQEAGHLRATWALLLALHLMAWPYILWHAPAEEWGVEHRAYREIREDERLRTLTAQMHANADASRALYRMVNTLDQGRTDSTYHTYADLELQERPSIYWFLVESYGQVLSTHPELKAPYAALIDSVETVLRRDGWHMATTVGPAPIRGGRSWLSHATLLSGVRIHRQLLNDRLVRHRTYPSMVRTLQAQGYHTVGLKPPNRARPGLPLSDPYDFDRMFYLNDLNYEGPRYGWGIVPDQYSLYYAHEQALKGNDPFFLFFSMVDSHALWKHGLIPYVDDWRVFNEGPGVSAGGDRRWIRQHRREDRPELVPDSLSNRFIFQQAPHLRYFRTIAHNWRLLRDYIRADAPDDALVWVMGDHQPPVLSSQSPDVPIHVFARDPERLQPFLEQGFTRGLPPNPSAQTAWPLEGLYSLTMRALAQYNDLPPEAAPLRPEGVPYRMLAP